MNAILVKRRFRGPPGVGNGGYVSGTVARGLGASAEVTLRRRTPLEAPLELTTTREGAELRQGDALIAEGRPTEFDIGDVPRVSFAQAEAAAAQPVSDPSIHLFRDCFVCGCGRPHEDGLRLFPGPVDRSRPRGTWTLAAPWVPAANLAGPDGRVDPVFVWAALDCPAGMALSAGQLGDPADPPIFLLGRQALRLNACPRPGERCVVVTWPAGQEGRRHFAEGALLGEDGDVLAVSRSTWIQVERSSVFGG